MGTFDAVRNRVNNVILEATLALAKSDVIVSRPHVGEGTEGKCALHLAHVVFEDGLRAKGLGQMEAVFNLERLAEGPLLGAGTHDAGGDPAGVACLDANITYLKLHSF